MNEQIEKQAIEEMANDLMICHVEFGEDDDIRTDYEVTATMLYRDKGYRKQREGVWIWTEDDKEECWICSECGERDDFGSKFCPNCGAHMRGGSNG